MTHIEKRKEYFPEAKLSFYLLFPSRDISEEILQIV